MSDRGLMRALDALMGTNRVTVELSGRFSDYPKELQIFIKWCNDNDLNFCDSLAPWKAEMSFPSDLDKPIQVVFKNRSCYNKFVTHFKNIGKSYG